MKRSLYIALLSLIAMAPAHAARDIDAIEPIKEAKQKISDIDNQFPTAPAAQKAELSRSRAREVDRITENPDPDPVPDINLLIQCQTSTYWRL